MFPPDRSGDAAESVIKLCRAVAIGAGGSGHAADAIVEGGDAVGVGARAAGDAARAIVGANVLRIGGASAASVVNSAMVVIRMVDLIVVRSRAMMRQIMLPSPVALRAAVLLWGGLEVDVPSPSTLSRCSDRAPQRTRRDR